MVYKSIFIYFVYNSDSDRIPMSINEKSVGILGLITVLILISAIIIFGYANEEFSFLNDYISKLGAKGEPNALWFNVIGFTLVGILLFMFGFTYGLLLNDKILSILLSLFLGGLHLPHSN